MNIVTMIQAWWRGDLRIISLPAIPVVGEPVHFNAHLTEIESLLDPGGRVDAQDPVYHVVHSRFFSEDNHKAFTSWLESHDIDITYDDKYWDCDDYALSYWAWCRLLYARDNKGAAAPFIGYCKSSAINHVFNFAITESGLLFIEPQTGKVISNPGGMYWMQF